MVTKKKTQSKQPKKEKESDKTSKQPVFYRAVGRRKEASARVRLYPVINSDVKIDKLILTKGDIVVNGRPIEEYFRGEIYKKYYLEPFRTTNTIGRFATSIKVVGGGFSGQLGAIIHGIARALLKVDEERFRPILRKRGFLTRDARVKERRKAGLAGKARAKKQSPKR